MPENRTMLGKAIAAEGKRSRGEGTHALSLSLLLAYVQAAKLCENALTTKTGARIMLEQTSIFKEGKFAAGMLKTARYRQSTAAEDATTQPPIP